MRKFELELYAKPWTMTIKKPSKIVYFEVEKAPINEAELLGCAYAEMRLWEFIDGKKEFIVSGAI